MDAARDRRLPALDGLRGIAAIVVLLSHVVMAGVGPVSQAIENGGDPKGVAWWFTRTPLAIAWAGPELVIVFFVLSGFVLTRALRDRPVPIGAFLAGRAVRLYLPVWLSLGGAALLIWLIPRAPSFDPWGTGIWLNAYAQDGGAETVARDLALVLPDHVGLDQGTLNGVLWSLRWEVLFSLVLPFALLARDAIARWAVPIVALALLSAYAGDGQAALRYVPPLAIGVVLALHEAQIRAWRDALAGRGAPLAVAVVACLLSADLWRPGVVRGSGLGGTLVLVGATLAVLLPLMYGSVERALTRAPVRWLGSRSFSLYLVHFPIVLAFAYGLDQPPFGILLALVVPTSLLAAEAFHRVAERPCHALARAATAQIASRRRAQTAPATATV